MRLLCTAHSLPQRVIDAGDPYPHLVAETAAAVDPGAEVAWQSAGRTPEPWLGPDVLDVIRGTPPGHSVLVCACGFVADHLEVLYDLDVEAKRVADEHAVGFGRTASLNDDADRHGGARPVGRGGRGGVRLSSCT